MSPFEYTTTAKRLLYSGSILSSGITPPPSYTLRPPAVRNSEISESGIALSLPPVSAPSDPSPSSCE